MRRRNPGAWIVDFTNPVGIVTRALLAHGHRAVGLCNVAIGFQRKFAALLGVSPARSSWSTSASTTSPGSGRYASGARTSFPGCWRNTVTPSCGHLRMPRPLLDRLGVVPSYYLRYYYQHDAVVRELRGTPSRAAEVAAIERQLLEMYGDPVLDEKPELLSRRGGAFYSEAAVALTSSLLRDVGGTQVVNTLNRGTLPFLPDDAVIEVPATVDSTGATPSPYALEPLYAGLVAHVTAYEHLALEAALWGRDGRNADRSGGRDAVFSALLAHPLIGQTDHADRLTDELLAHNREHLTWA